MSFTDHLIAYLDAPSPERLDVLRRAIRAAPSYRLDFSAEAVALPLIEQGAHREAIDALLERMPGAFFSPAAHGLLAAAYAASGDSGRAAREEGLAQAAMRAILDSGDGSRAQPWLVLRISDEYDVLRALGKRSQGQRLVRDGERLYDMHEGDDGSELWFDISILYAEPASA